MASPLTAEFLEAWRHYDRRRGHCVVKVELTNPSALTLRLAGTELETPDGTYEFALQDVGPIVAEGGVGAPGPSHATFSFSLLNRRLSAQSSGTALNLLASHVWYGAAVVVYFWEESLSAWNKAAQVFEGTVIRHEVEGLQAKILCRSSVSALRQLPATVIRRDTDPRAPEASMGLPRGGIIIGSHRSPPAREPASPYGLFQQGITSCYGGQAAVRGVITKVGRGAGGEKGQVLFASHACKTFNSDVDGTTPFIEAGDKLCEIDPTVGDVLNSAADGTGFNLADITAAFAPPFYLFAPAPAIDVQLAAANNADSPRSAIDVVNDFHYTLLDYDAGTRRAYWRLPNLGDVGKATTYRYIIGYSTSAGATKPTILLRKDGGAAEYFNLAASTTPTVQSVTVVGGATILPDRPFDMTAHQLEAYFADGTGAEVAAAGESFKIHYVGVVVKGTPNGTIVARGALIPNPQVVIDWLLNDGNGFPSAKNMPQPTYAPDRIRFNLPGSFYATLEGWADDGGGTYTGVAAALVEKPPDALRLLLLEYLDQVAGDIETASSTFGSLVDARAQLLTWRQSVMKTACAITELRQSSDVIKDVMRGAFAWAYVSRFDGKWHVVPWKTGRAVDYDYKLSYARRDLVDIEGPNLDEGVEDVENNIEVRYWWDDWQRRLLFSSYAREDASQAGQLYRNLRDENTTVVASASDRLDFTDGFGAHTVNLTPAEYDPPIELAQHLTTQMNSGSTDDYLNGWGATIVAGYNDLLDINDGAVKQATVAPGAYATMEARAVAVAAALNAVSTNWSCTYSRTTRKTTIARSAGTCQLLCNSGAGRLQSAYSTLGFECSTDKTAAATYTGAFEREEERFFIQCLTNPVDLNFETGANGINGTLRNCAVLLGFDTVRDLTGGVQSHLAHCPKNTRELRLAQSVARYGARRLLPVDLPYCKDTDTAREVRNRMIDLFATARPRVAFSSERMPDIERGRVIEFDADWDELKPYTGLGSDGSWAGKKFMVYRVIQHCGAPTFETEVEAVEVS